MLVYGYRGLCFVGMPDFFVSANNSMLRRIYLKPIKKIAQFELKIVILYHLK